MIEEGLVITAIGMGVVFIFLSILVLSVKVTSILILKYEGKRKRTSVKEPVEDKDLLRMQPVSESMQKEFSSKTVEADYIALAVALAYDKKNT